MDGSRATLGGCGHTGRAPARTSPPPAPTGLPRRSAGPWRVVIRATPFGDAGGRSVCRHGYWTAFCSRPRRHDRTGGAGSPGRTCQPTRADGRVAEAHHRRSRPLQWHGCRSRRHSTAQKCAHDRALGGVDPPNNVLPCPVRPWHVHVIVAEHLAADDVQGARLLEQLVVGALARPLPLELPAEVLNHGDELIGGRVHLPFLVFQVKPHLYPRLGEFS